jgi:hypothetical protein
MDVQAIIGAYEAHDFRLESALLEFINSEGNDLHSDSDTEHEECHIFDEFLRVGGMDSIINMCNFTLAEFNILYGICEDSMILNFESGRGRRSKISSKDILFLTLVVLKHYQKWEKTCN